MTIRRLAVPDLHAYRALMLDAYEHHPDAFTSSAAERAALPLAWWESRLADTPDAAEIVLGAFHEGRLVGAGGLSFEPREKARHKATLFGMYVAPAARQGGHGRQLVMAALATARARAGVILVQLTVTDCNAAARSLYEQCGFVAFGVEPLAVAVGPEYVAKVHMWCDLRARELHAEPQRQSGIASITPVDGSPHGADAAMAILGPGPLAAATAERVLRTLPQWFGVESALRGYAADAGTMPNFVAIDGDETIGFLTLREHNPDTVEINCIAVVPGRHRNGVGTALCEAATRWWSARGGRLMQVKTLGPSRVDAHYARTRAFYAAQGYLPVEEFPRLWPGYPCLLLVRPLAGPGS